MTIDPAVLAQTERLIVAQRCSDVVARLKALLPDLKELSIDI